MIRDILFSYLKTDVTVLEGDDFVVSVLSTLVARGPVYVITAWNPGDERPSLETNRARNEVLRDDLHALGATPVSALGSDPDSDHAEESWACTGITEDVALELGAKYGQVAIFEITSTDQTVIRCDNSWRISRRNS